MNARPGGCANVGPGIVEQVRRRVAPLCSRRLRSIRPGSATSFTCLPSTVPKKAVQARGVTSAGS